MSEVRKAFGEPPVLASIVTRIRHDIEDGLTIRLYAKQDSTMLGKDLATVPHVDVSLVTRR